jgi:hypothetical protein
MDPGTGIAYLYGGTTSTSTGAAQRGGATLGDLWAYDLAADTWEPVVGTSDEPPPRSGHVAAWVEDVGLVVVGGRGSDGGALGDVWRFDPTTGAWSRIRVAGKTPPARWDACGAAPGDGTLWLTHGTTGRSLLGDTWRLELSAKRWTVVGRPDAPSARSGSACWVDPGGRFVLFGGATSVAQGDLDATTVEVGGGGAWERMAGPGAFPPRSRAASAVHLDRAVIVGGLGADDVVRSDTGELRPTDDTIDPVAADGPTPAARAGAVLVDDPAGERMLLFGGVTADGVSGELWAADLR